MISGQSPDTFDVTEEGTDASLSARGVRVRERVSGKNDEGVGSIISLLVVVVGLLMLMRLRSVSVPKADGRVQSASEHVAWWCRAFGIIWPERNGLRGVRLNVVVCRADTASIVILVTRLEGIVIDLKLWWHELELLYLANVTFEDLQALLRVEIP